MKKCAKCLGYKTCPFYKNGYCVPKRKKSKSLFHAYIWKKHSYFDNPLESFQYNVGFCFNDFKKLNRYFENKSYIIEGIQIKVRASKKIIYRGANYQEMLKAIEDFKASQKEWLNKEFGINGNMD